MNLNQNLYFQFKLIRYFKYVMNISICKKILL